MLDQAPVPSANERQAAPRRATFYGTAYHKVSARNQVALPRHHLRTAIEAQEGQLLLVRFAEEKFLRLYTQDQLTVIIDGVRKRTDLDENVRDMLVQSISTEAEIVEPDSQGRFVLPQKWVDELGLKEEIAFCGAQHRIEIWAAGARREKDARDKDMLKQAAPKITGLLNL